MFILTISIKIIYNDQTSDEITNEQARKTRLQSRGPFFACFYQRQLRMTSATMCIQMQSVLSDIFPSQFPLKQRCYSM